MEMSNELSENVMMIRNERFEETKRKKTSTKKEKRLCKNKCEYRFSLRGTDIWRNSENNMVMSFSVSE